MNSLIQALGLDGRILLAQFLNFAVLIFVLWRFAYKPVFKILEDRRQKIAKGVSDSDKAEVKLQEAEDEKQQIISEARKEAIVIIDEAKTKAEFKYQEIVDRAKKDLKVVIDDEKSKIAAERKKASLEIKKEATSLIISALEKILPERVSDKEDEKIISQVIKELE